MDCQHEGCLCQVEGDQDYCSDYCREHSMGPDHGMHECECGHTTCAVNATG